MNVYVPELMLSTVAGAHVPVIPLVEVPGNVGAVDPAQNGATCVNAGATGWFTVMFIVVVVAQNPAFGVNVYVPELMLSTVAGDHVPVMLLFEVAGSVGAAEPAQKEVICVNVGVAGGPTVTVIVAVVAHSPAFGVNV